LGQAIISILNLNRPAMWFLITVGAALGLSIPWLSPSHSWNGRLALQCCAIATITPLALGCFVNLGVLLPWTVGVGRRGVDIRRGVLRTFIAAESIDEICIDRRMPRRQTLTISIGGRDVIVALDRAIGDEELTSVLTGVDWTREVAVHPEAPGPAADPLGTAEQAE
jgi:hypothetical protein